MSQAPGKVVYFGGVWRDTENPTPFDRDALEASKACDFGHWSDESHLRASSIGVCQLDFKEKSGIAHAEVKMPEHQLGAYLHDVGSRRPGRIQYSERALSSTLSHELRHAWQHLCLPVSLRNPDSPQGVVLLQRWLEADARAVAFASVVQAVSVLEKSAYTDALVATLDDHPKQVLEYSFDTLNKMAESPPALKQAMRQVFDGWLSLHVPQAQCYTEQTEETLRRASTSRARKAFYKAFNGGRERVHCFTRAEMDPGYPRALAAELGKVEGMGNYLTETQGASFDSGFYARISDFRLERQVKAIQARIRGMRT
jgi:hypothetical protein